MPFNKESEAYEFSGTEGLDIINNFAKELGEVVQQSRGPERSRNLKNMLLATTKGDHNALMVAVMFKPEVVDSIKAAVMKLTELKRSEVLTDMLLAVNYMKRNALMLAARHGNYLVWRINSLLQALPRSKRSEVLADMLLAVDRDDYNALMLAASYQNEYRVYDVLYCFRQIVQTRYSDVLVKMLSKTNQQGENALVMMSESSNAHSSHVVYADYKARKSMFIRIKEYVDNLDEPLRSNFFHSMLLEIIISLPCNKDKYYCINNRGMLESGVWVI